MIDAALLEILRCPESYQVLKEADATLVQSINAKIKSGEVRNRGGQPVTEMIDGGLIRNDLKFLYPVRGGIPVMLVDEALPL